MINFFYPENLYALIISLCNLSKKNNVIILSKNIYLNIFNLTKFLEKKLNIKFIFVDNFDDVENIILQTTKPQKKSIINFFHKKTDKNLLIRLIEKNINFIYLEHGIGNYYNFSNRNKILILKDYLLNYENKKFKFYTGIYTSLKKNIYIDGYKVDKIKPKKINFILNILKEFYRKNKYFKNVLKQLSSKRENILVNVPEILTNYDFNTFINKLSYLNNLGKIFFKFHPFDKKRVKRARYIKKIFKKNKKNFFLLNEKFDQIPLEVLISYSAKCKIYSTISNVPFVISILFKNPVYIHLPNSLKKKFLLFNELKKEAYNFYKRNFKKIKFI